MFFYNGQTVEFKNRKNEILTGTVVKAPRRQSSRSKITVTVENGDTYGVPASLLKPSDKKISTAALAEKGLDLLQKRAERTEADRPRREARAEKQGKRLAHRFENLKVGQQVEVFSRDQWSVTTITKLIPETGKVQVVNPTARVFNTFGLGAGIKTPETITVLADRIRARLGHG